MTCDIVIGSTILGFKLIKQAHKRNYSNNFESELGYANDTFSVTYPSLCVYHLKKAYVVGQDGFTFTQEKKMIGDNSEFKFYDKKKIRKPLPFVGKRIEGKCFHLSGKNYENHGHFVTQFLPRLMVFRDFLLGNPNIKIIISKGQLNWQSIYFEALGFSKERFIETQYGTLQCDELIYVPNFHGSDSLVPCEYYQDLKKIFLKSAGKQKLEGYKIIFLSRDNAPNRKIINEEEIISIISKRMKMDVKRVFLENYSLPEQIGLFQSAKYVFGPQGQAFLGALFATNSIFTILDLNMNYKYSRDWAISFRNLGTFTNNKMSRLYVDCEIQKNRNWIQSQKETIDHIDKLLSLN
tara:strand:- start:1938 stop:2990 length:1053 start_codon:yes stop_codon:yes gene_type:complete